MILITLTIIALGRIHVSSAPAAAIETLCFNYTVGFFKSVAVLSRLPCRPYAARIPPLTPDECEPALALHNSLNDSTLAQAPRATLYPEVTEPICRLPLDALSSHQGFLAQET
jgi:hypothetical protein